MSGYTESTTRLSGTVWHGNNSSPASRLCELTHDYTYIFPCSWTSAPMKAAPSPALCFWGVTLAVGKGQHSPFSQLLVRQKGRGMRSRWQA